MTTPTQLELFPDPETNTPCQHNSYDDDDTDDDSDEDKQVVVGFASAVGNPTPKKHTHEFRPFNDVKYRKRGEEDLSYVMLFCNCGTSKEVIAEDRRSQTHTE